jgi:hypothetical protein
MADVILTLQLPKGDRFIPIAMTNDRAVLEHFKTAVLAQWREQVQSSIDEIEALTQRAEFDRLTRLLDALIPTENRDENKID